MTNNDQAVCVSYETFLELCTDILAGREEEDAREDVDRRVAEARLAEAYVNGAYDPEWAWRLFHLGPYTLLRATDFPPRLIIKDESEVPEVQLAVAQKLAAAYGHFWAGVEMPPVLTRWTLAQTVRAACLADVFWGGGVCPVWAGDKLVHRTGSDRLMWAVDSEGEVELSVWRPNSDAPCLTANVSKAGGRVEWRTGQAFASRHVVALDEAMFTIIEDREVVDDLLADAWGQVTDGDLYLNWLREKLALARKAALEEKPGYRSLSQAEIERRLDYALSCRMEGANALKGPDLFNVVIPATRGARHVDTYEPEEGPTQWVDPGWAPTVGDAVR